MITVFKTVEFAAAHDIPNHPGKCRGLHGHNYVVTVGITNPTGEVDSVTGMVEDFGDVKIAIQATIIDKCDHKYLNDVYPDMLTTAELLAQRWLKELREIDKRYMFIRVFETGNSSVEIDLRLPYLAQDHVNAYHEPGR